MPATEVNRLCDALKAQSHTTGAAIIQWLDECITLGQDDISRFEVVETAKAVLATLRHGMTRILRIMPNEHLAALTDLIFRSKDLDLDDAAYRAEWEGLARSCVVCQYAAGQNSVISEDDVAIRIEWTDGTAHGKAFRCSL